ncbi:ABC transporter ATP-binding protein [Sediminitomix flava]|uniref:Nitrate/nitrite transport system ATP-binding protein n=1 Tax=Sediminitomix flava TaxID=379075 RepID=A0A315ZFQ4_SEDFL|nr:ABC transporter ATP-binding protein [Sediminitomix flava]PWJ44341.1 nitrate/nitrite transport system ATP-binding protein [Sediminitomix flava]
MAFLELKGVSKSFGTGKDKVEVLKDINLSIEEGEFLAIVGFTGSGKTTLINLINGLEFPDEGEVLLNGKPITGPGPDRGVVFQNYSLLPWLSVYQNVKLAIDEVYPKASKAEKDERIRKYVEMVHLSHAIDKKPTELSGGMRQRVSVARALAMNPQVLLMDEPLSALDALTRGTLQEEIVKIWGEDQKTCLLITNDVDEGIIMADRIIPLTPGPRATLGPEFKVNFARPRVIAEINKNPEYKHLRNEILEYLIEVGANRKAEGGETYTLPDLKPVMPTGFFSRFMKSKKRA